MSVSLCQPVLAPDLFSYPKYWAECFGVAPYLPMTRAEMDALGWDSCDIILVTGDAYVDHPSFGMAVIGRMLESQGFRVGIISQPAWQQGNPEADAAYTELGKPNLFFGVTGGNMDSMINRYTADLRMRSDDAYTAGGQGGNRPDRCVIVYTQRCRQAYADVPIVIGGIEASLRRIAQYDYWSDSVRRSVLVDSGADILLYGNAERALCELAHIVASGKGIAAAGRLRGTTTIIPAPPAAYVEVDSTRIDWPNAIDKMPNPYHYDEGETDCDRPERQAGAAPVNTADVEQVVKIIPMPLATKTLSQQGLSADQVYIRLPSFEKVRNDPVLYAHASRVLHQESNPHNARALIQKHGNREIWVNPPPIPLSTDELDGVFALPYQRRPHPSYGEAKIPAYDMIKTSVNIMRGCFGGCTFCSITEHEGRVIQSRSEQSVLDEIEKIRDQVPGFTGSISDLGGPTANMYHLNCKDDVIQANCRRLSCVYPTICKNLETDHTPTTQLYRKARALRGIKRILIASGLRYDLAILDEEYVKELVTHHVGGYLKIAPEHSEDATLSKMMKPGMGSYDTFKKMFEKYTKLAKKKQYLIPYFIAAHPGCTDEEMLNLSLWLKDNDFRVDQVQTFYPSPMALATAMYHSGRNPLKKLVYKRGEKVFVAKNLEQRRLQKAFLRYHDEKNWAYLRESLIKMNRSELIGDGPNQLVPAEASHNRRGGGGRKLPGNKARGGQWSSRSKK